MSTKEERYDPGLGVDCGYDSEDSDFYNDPEIDGILEEQCSGYLGLFRRGGPLADNDGGKKGDAPLPGQKVGNCKMPKCKKKGVPLFQGNCYPCHRTHSKERQNQHNSMCKQCASGLDEDGEILVCYAHGEQAEEDEDDPLPAMKD